MIKVVVDAMGGDNAPEEIVKGVSNALNKFNDLFVYLCGKSSDIEKYLKKYPCNPSQYLIKNADDVITNDESPVNAFKNKANSSLVVAYDILKLENDVCGLVSAGSTGAILTGTILKIGRIKGVNRPSLATMMPTRKKGKQVILIDCGANIDCKPINLAQFAIMGNEYAKLSLGIEKPKIALLSVGTEDKKGNEVTHQAFELIKGLDLNFVGNCEARDVVSGDYDVVVSDGFAGNVLLKATEGGIQLLLSELKASIKRRFLSKIGALLMKNTFKDIKMKLDYNHVGGAPFIGAKKLVIKSHGSSNSVAIVTVLSQIRYLVKNNFIENLTEVFSNTNLNISTPGSDSNAGN